MSDQPACFECGKPAEFNHHVVPVIYGGTKTVPLCAACHGKVHDQPMLNHRALTKAGMAKVMANGMKFGGDASRRP